MSSLENRVTSFQGVESNEMIRRNKGEGNYLWTTDINTQKRGERTGLDTLVVHALTYECENIFLLWSLASNYTAICCQLNKKFILANAKAFRLGTTAARLKLKGIDGGSHKRWSMWLNA